MPTRLRLLLVAALVALATGCWDFTAARLLVHWDPDAGTIRITEELRDLRANDDGACFDDASRCADFLAAELKEGNILELDDSAKILDEHFRARDGELDLVVRFEIPDDGPAAQQMGFAREELGKLGKERHYLGYTNDDTLPLQPVDPPHKLLHRRLADPPDESWLIDTRRPDLLLATPPSNETPETPGVLVAMPDLEGLLRERGLLSP